MKAPPPSRSFFLGADMWQRVCRLVALGAGAALAHDNNVGIHDYYADDTSRGVFTSADDHVRARGAGLTLRWSTSSYNMGVDFVLEYSGEAWLGLAISSDGHMVGGGPRWRYASWLQGRQTPTPAFVADWKGGDAGVNHYVMDDYTEKGVRLIGDANGYGIARGPDPTGHMQVCTLSLSLSQQPQLLFTCLCPDVAQIVAPPHSTRMSIPSRVFCWPTCAVSSLGSAQRRLVDGD